MTPPDQPISKDVLYYAFWTVALLAGGYGLKLLYDIRNLLK